MLASPEGVGSLKFSLARFDSVLQLMRGATPLAALSPDGEGVMLLLVTAPQVWEAAHDLLKAVSAKGPLTPAEERLAGMLAKAAGKNRWVDL